MDVLLDINSDQRDPNEYPFPQDYTVCLNRPWYNVSKMELKAAKIPISQTLICGTNNTFSLTYPTGTTDFSLPNQNVTDGTALSTLLNTLISGSTGVSSTFDSDTNSLTFTHGAGPFTFNFYSGTNGFDTLSSNGTPASIMGLPHQDISSTSVGPFTLSTGPINLYPPTSLILRLTVNGDGDDLNKDIYISNGKFSFGNVNSTSNVELDKTESCYFGRILTYDSYSGNEYLTYQGGYPIEDYFHKGPEKSIFKLRIRFYYTIGGKLIPYNFGYKNHTLKFKIHCNLDKLDTLRANIPIAEDIQKNLELPPPIDLPGLDPPKRTDNDNKKRIFIISFIFLLSGLFFMLFT
jgi:hypothetical protein